MDIWILVIILLVIAIALFAVSYFVNDEDKLDEKLSEFSVQQSSELYNIKTRLSKLEESILPLNQPAADYPDGDQVQEVSNDVLNQIISYYQEGYTMQEIAAILQLNLITIQSIVDDYIENR